MSWQFAMVAVALSAISAGSHQSGAFSHAIQGARLVPVSSPPIPSGTIVFREGRIISIGAKVTVPPGAQVLDGKGLTVYPGLIDLGSSAGLAVPPVPRAENPRTTEDVERVKLDTLLRPQLRAADHVSPAAPMLARMAAAGITTVLATPPGDAIRGYSALLHTAQPLDDPQIGALADERKGPLVVKTPVALHISFPERPAGGDAYPNSLMGSIAFVRQQLLDAQHYQAVGRKQRAGGSQPYRAAHEALAPALAAEVPVMFQAESAREIVRALDMAQAFNMRPIITRAREADQLPAELKSANAAVVYSLNFPTRAEALAPEADEPLRVMRARVNAPKIPATLDKNGLLFGFASDDLREPKDFLKNAAKTVAGGLPSDAALKALTLNAATIAGASDRLGSLETGKAANLVITDGDLFAEKTTIKHVFVAGTQVRLDPPAETTKPSR